MRLFSTMIPRIRSWISIACAAGLGLEAGCTDLRPEAESPASSAVFTVDPSRIDGAHPADLDASYIIPTPAGYGHYCSVVDAGGGWHLSWVNADHDPCGDMLAQFGAGAKVKRAGLFDWNGMNNILVQCKEGHWPFAGAGGQAITDTAAYMRSTPYTACSFTISPQALPIFARPWAPAVGETNPDAGVSKPSGFNYNVRGGWDASPAAQWDVTRFGNQGAPAGGPWADQPATKPVFGDGDPDGTHALIVDRYGREGMYARGIGRFYAPFTHTTEAQLDYYFTEVSNSSNATRRALVAAAPGRLRGARMRHNSGCDSSNGKIGEIFIEHQVDAGWYAEHFVVAYRHLDDVDNPSRPRGTPWTDGPLGEYVTEGQVIGYVGTSCTGAANWHLDIAFHRLTNMAGGYGYVFQAVPADPAQDSNGTEAYSGVNGLHSVIDPYGWAVPNAHDPWAYLYIGSSLDDPFFSSKAKGLVSELGAYSGNLWKGSPPPVQSPNIAIGSNTASQGSISSYIRADSVSAVVFTDSNKHVRELALGGAGWAPSDLSGAAAVAASEPSAYVRTDHVSSVVYRSADNHVRELKSTQAGWLAADLTALASAPVLAAGKPSPYRRLDGVNAVIYRGQQDLHVHELTQSGAAWIDSDLTVAAGAATSSAGDPVGYVRGDGVNAVIYRSADGHIREIAWVGTRWLASDLMVAAATSDTAVGNPAAYVRSDGVTSVLYRNSNSHIAELALSGNAWTHSELSGASAPAAASDPSGYIRGDSVNSVVYRSVANRICELTLGSGGWTPWDLSSTPPGAPDASGAPSAYVRADGFSSVIFRGLADGHVHELFMSKAGAWGTGDLGN
jgi:hypothetical protein